jgi:hypothetical protein
VALGAAVHRVAQTSSAEVVKTTSFLFQFFDENFSFALPTDFKQVKIILEGLCQRQVSI